MSSGLSNIKNFFWDYSKAKVFQKQGTLGFLAVNPLWVRLEVNVRWVLKTTWTELSNEYKTS